MLIELSINAARHDQPNQRTIITASRKMISQLMLKITLNLVNDKGEVDMVNPVEAIPQYRG